MIEDYEENTVLIAATPMPEAVQDFGVLEVSENDRLEVKSVVEKPAPDQAPSDLVAFGRWILPPLALEELRLQSSQTAGEISLTSCINRLSGRVAIRAVRFDGACFDVRGKTGLIKATVARALQSPDLSSAVSTAHRDFIDAGVRTLRSVQLSRRYEELTAFALLAQLAEREFARKIALVSSFGAASAVLLHMIARIDPAMPVLFLETGMLFRETLDYQRRLSALLGLEDVRVVRPAPADITSVDPDGVLHRSAADTCCHVRKTLPLERALEPFAAWITGRKRFQGATRATLPRFEEDGGGRVKVNPLVAWTRSDLADYLQRHRLPAHPLVAEGYPSIGCRPCTSQVSSDEDERAGRWRGSEKAECGIHLVSGKLVRREPSVPPIAATDPIPPDR